MCTYVNVRKIIQRKEINRIFFRHILWRFIDLALTIDFRRLDYIVNGILLHTIKLLCTQHSQRNVSHMSVTFYRNQITS